MLVVTDATVNARLSLTHVSGARCVAERGAPEVLLVTYSDLLTNLIFGTEIAVDIFTDEDGLQRRESKDYARC